MPNEEVISEEVSFGQSDLQKFNEAVIKKMEEDKDANTGKVKVIGINMSNPTVAVTRLNFNDGIPGLAIVKLTDDVKKPLYERVDSVALILTFSDSKSVQKIMQWLTLIYDQLYVGDMESLPLTDIV